MAKNNASPLDMPTVAAATGPTGEGDRANMTLNKQHQLSGKMAQIKIYPGSKEDPKDQFFGLNHYQITIRRGKWVEVPVEMADHIQGLTLTEREQDPDFPDDPDKFVWVDKPRFPIERRDPGR